MTVKRLTTHGAALLGLALMTLFYTVGQEIPRQLANIGLLGASVTITIGWWPAAQRAFAEGVRTGRQLIIVTIWMSWTTLLFQRIYTIINESLDRPEWLTSSPGSIIVATLIMISGLYAIIAPITDPEVLAKEKKWDRAAILIGIMVSVCAAIIYYIVG